MNKQFWIIDTDTPGMSMGQFSASGPYPTKKAAEAALLKEHRELWETSCNCLQSDHTQKWCKPQHIVEVIATVVPKVTAKITLENCEA